jgi:hypothetical protein
MQPSQCPIVWRFFAACHTLEIAGTRNGTSMNEDKTEKESPLQLLQKWLRKRRQNQQVIKHFGKDIDTIVKEAKQNLLRKYRGILRKVQAGSARSVELVV